MRDIARAQIGRRDFDHYAPAGRERFHVVRKFHGFQRLFENGRDFARDTVHALAVGTVRRHRNIENIIVDPHHFFDIRTDGNIFLQDENAVHFRARVIIVGNAEFLARTQHTARFHAAQFAFFDLDAAV